MDPKTWLRRKKSSEKASGQEVLLAVKVTDLERSVENLNEKLSSALSECKAKDDLATKHAKTAEDALAGWEKTKAEATSLKQNLDKALQQRVVAEERISHLDAALKECMQQLRFVREEQEQRIQDAVMKTSNAHEKVQMAIEEKLAETKKSLSKLDNENNHLSKVIQVKEKLIEDLKAHNSQAEADFDKLRAKLDSMQKDNASMNYELRMLEKEVEIRNEEREFNRRSTDASHKQHLESVKKIAKLETECQRLRFLVQKRLPGPAALARMKTEVDMLGKDHQTGPTRSKLSPPMAKDFSPEKSPESPNKNVNYLLERLCDIEEENKTLKEAVSNKTNELQSSKIMCARTASKLSQVEAQLAELSKSTNMELPRTYLASRRLSFASESDINASEDAESCSPSLFSEMENFRNEKIRGSPSCKTVGSSDISLMDDFAEMEKLAIVCMDKSPVHSHVSSGGSPALLSTLEAKSGLSPSEATGKELVPVIDSHSGLSDRDQEVRPKDTFGGKYPGWLQDILRTIMEQNRLTRRNLDEIIEETKVAMEGMSHTRLGEVIDQEEKSSLSSPSKLPHVSGYIFSKEVSAKQLQSGLKESVSKIIELIERINQQSSKDISSEQLLSEDSGRCLPYKTSLTPTGYTYRVFQWKSTELTHVLRQFVHTCNDLLNGEAEFEDFAGQLSSTFEWIMNHCFSLQDVSSMRDAIKKQFDWDESRSESEQATEELSSCGASSAASNAKKFASQVEETIFNLNKENNRLKHELTEVESSRKELEANLQSATDKVEALITKLQESEKNTANLQTEVEALKASKLIFADQIENHKLLNEDLNTQLTVIRTELSEAHQKLSSLEVELEERKNTCQELETTCLEQQLQLESATKNEQACDPNQKEKPHQNGWEISEASEKLAECQETILNLGKQLKALATPRDTVPLDKVISVTPSTNTSNNHRSSLLDQILSEHGNGHEGLESPKMKEIICTMDSQKASTHPPDNIKSVEQFSGSNETNYKNSTAVGGALAIIPSKKRGGGLTLLRKLLSSQKRDTSRRMSLPMNA